jgi:hypothetical protein
LIAAVLAGLLLAAPPADHLVQRLVDRGSAAINSQWVHVKETKDPAEQRERIKASKLTRTRCNDLVDLLALQRAGYPLLRRDFVRDRTAGRPEMLALVAGGMELLRQKRPAATITAGDIAQQGCGQIRWGTIVRFVSAKEAKAVRKGTTLTFGELTQWLPESPDAFMGEFPRFQEDPGPVWVEQRLTGRAKNKRERLETRRFNAGRRLSADSVGRLLERTSKRVRARRRVVWDRVKHAADGATQSLRRATWTGANGRWMEAVFRPGKRGKIKRGKVTARNLLRVREARWDAKKPLSFKVEERYLFDSDGEAGFRVTRYQLQYEAHHTSHIAGFDADLSYVTFGNLGHFAPAEGALDPEGSLVWLKALQTAAKKLDIPLLALFADRSVIDVLKTVPGVSRKDPVWRKIRRSPGHDSHVHIRIGRSARWAGKSAADVLAEVKRRLSP